MGTVKSAAERDEELYGEEKGFAKSWKRKEETEPCGGCDEKKKKKTEVKEQEVIS